LKDKLRLIFNRARVKRTKAMIQESRLRILGVLLFCLGVGLGLGLLGASVYADFEASLFDIPWNAENKIHPFTCPILIDVDEIGIIRATVKNDSNETVYRTITGHFSQYSALTRREETFRTIFDPYESKNMYWEVSADDAVYGHLILVKVYLFGRVRTPAEEAGCGVIALDLPWGLSGKAVVIIILLLSVALLVIGGRLWWLFTYPKVGIVAEESRGVISLIVTLVLGLMASYWGYFTISIGLFYISVLMVSVMVPHFIFSRWRVW
jgi:hypothetical protein